MSKTHLVVLLPIAIGASACAARAPQSTSPIHYACGDSQVVRSGDRLKGEPGAMPASLGWRDDEGDHFVSWPNTTTDVVATEYVIPSDRRKDAVEKTYDTTKGYSTSDWRLVRRQTCRAEGGYNDALARFMDGASMDDLAHRFDLDDPAAARKLVHTALMSLQKKYLRER